MTLRTVLQIMALVVGVATPAFATSPDNRSSQTAVAGAAEAINNADTKTADADSTPGKGKKEGTEPVIESDCLKEGEPCNLITNRCCPGYSCQGGLAATCVPKN